jgi:hypothetical protein
MKKAKVCGGLNIDDMQQLHDNLVANQAIDCYARESREMLSKKVDAIDPDKIIFLDSKGIPIEKINLRNIFKVRRLMRNENYYKLTGQIIN